MVTNNFLSLTSDTILAPMAGVTDVAFRMLCKNYGAGLTCTEMISANALARGNKATLKLIDTVPEEKPRMVQLFGQNTKNLVKAAKICEKQGSEIIDLNFGCPASKIIKQGAGSALLARPTKIKEIVEAVVEAVNLPITCKLRLGINKNKINVLKIAKICENAGAKMITLHARTQKQGYSGKAKWEWIKKLKETSQVPITANGDVCSVKDYLEIKKFTNCDYVMIGRAAMGNPFLFKQIKDSQQTGKYEHTTDKEKIEGFFEYLQLAEKYHVGFNQIKFHAQAFTKGIKGAKKARNKIVRAKEIKEIKEVLAKIPKIN